MIGEIHVQTNRQQGDLISLLLFFFNTKKVGQKWDYEKKEWLTHLLRQYKKRGDLAVFMHKKNARWLSKQNYKCSHKI
jgi:hypothetical protein